MDRETTPQTQTIASLFSFSGRLGVAGQPVPPGVTMAGAPLRPEELWRVLDLTQPGMEKVRAAVAADDLPAAATALLAYYRERREPGWMTGPSLGNAPRRLHVRADTLPKLSPTDADQETAAAAERHVFHMLGAHTLYEPHDYGPDIDWDANPVDDIEWVCGMHRFAFWDGPVTRCYSATGDERWARLWTGLMTDWIRKNALTAQRLPFGKSWNTIQVGIRCQQMAGYLPYYLNSDACTPDFLTLLLTSLYNHARRIELLPCPNPEGANFVQIEVLGLAYVAALFPEFREAAGWRDLVRARMDDIGQRQFHPDGVQRELSPDYHVMCANYHLDLLELFGVDALTEEQVAGIARMFDVILAIGMPDRQLFHVGDTKQNIDTCALLGRGARLLHRPDFLAAATDGREGQWPEQRNYAFPDGGFYSFRSGWQHDAIWLGLHAGAESLCPFHSQFDRGTFELMAFGRSLMTDPGIFNYKGGDPGREAFRRTAAHQCLTLNGDNAAQQGRCLQWVEDDNRGNAVLTVENASYANLTFRRTVFFVDRKYFVLVDEALGTAEGDIDLHFQLVPGPSVIDIAAKCARNDFPDGGNVLVWCAKNAQVSMGAEEAWFSPRWYEKVPLPAFRYRHDARQTPARFVTVLAPYKGRNVPSVEAALTEGEIGGKTVRLNLAVDGREHHLGRSLD